VDTKIVIITGMSGAGITTALNVLEDAGYYCVDNMPLALIPKFAELADGQKTGYDKIALGIDIRNGLSREQVETLLEEMERFKYKMLYIDCSDAVLIKRYKETRRSHPLAHGSRVDSAIADERDRMTFLKSKADYKIDTSQMLTRDLKQEIERLFLGENQYKNLFVNVLSFGFKYGIPSDADLVFDVRFLPNPYYVDELKNLTGNDEPVYSYVLAAEATQTFLAKIEDLISFLLPNYVKEGKNSLVIAFGCTGGKHRSVTLANAVASQLQKTEYGCKVEHRDIDKDSKRKKQE
jgi:UPF0042 nucleotide-binding protein